MNIFCTVFENIHVKSNADETDTYLDWLKRADDFCCASREVLSDHMLDVIEEYDLKRKIRLAHQMAGELFAKYPDRVMLHGDLHHDNILLNGAGGYSVIDPKGVVGPAIFDIPRFILNELDYIVEKTVTESLKHLKEVIDYIAGRLGYPIQDIMNLFYMEAVLANVWCIEDGEKVSARQLCLADSLVEEWVTPGKTGHEA